MKKYLIAGDVHWSQYSSIVRKRGSKYSVRLHNLLNSINYIESFATTNGCDGVIYLGDFFDRSECNAEEITALQDINWSKLEHLFIVGNHESNVNTLEYSTTKLFEGVGSKVYSTISRVVVNEYIDFYFIPYINGETPKLEDIIVDKTKKNIIFSHNDIAGLQYGKFISQTGFGLDEIRDNCTLFINGHLHNEQIIDNKIIIVGNATGANFNENAFKYRHLMYLLTVNDDGTITLDQYENPQAMNFYKLRIENKEDLSIFSKLKNNSVVSIYCVNTMLDIVTELLPSIKSILEYKLTVFYEEADSSVDTYNLKTEDHLKLFIDYVQSKLESSSILEDELARLGGSNYSDTVQNN